MVFRTGQLFDGVVGLEDPGDAVDGLVPRRQVSVCLRDACQSISSCNSHKSAGTLSLLARSLFSSLLLLHLLSPPPHTSLLLLILLVLSHSSPGVAVVNDSELISHKTLTAVSHSQGAGVRETAREWKRTVESRSCRWTNVSLAFLSIASTSSMK